jgi:BASS family bile acid:Na+ symporter
MGFLRRHLFSLLIIGGAFIAYSFPGPFTEIHGFKCARLIVPMIQIIMFGMGTNLSLSDFAEALRRPWPVIVGSLFQFSVMPTLGYFLARLAGFDGDVAAGVILIGSAAGGVASNVMAYIAGANVALSVSMTTVSTLLSPFVTPLLMRLLAGRFIEVDVTAMMIALVNMIFVPLLLSQLARYCFERWCRKAKEMIARALPCLSMAAICLIVTICVAAARKELASAGLLIFLVAIIHNVCGYLLGYWGTRALALVAPISERDCRTVAIEVGMQNAGMCQALAMDVMKSAAAALAPTIFGVWMDFSGSLLANWWKRRPSVLQVAKSTCRDNR